MKPLGHYTNKNKLYICGESVLGIFKKQKVESLSKKQIYKSIVEKKKLCLRRKLKKIFFIKKA